MKRFIATTSLVAAASLGLGACSSPSESQEGLVGSLPALTRAEEAPGITVTAIEPGDVYARPNQLRRVISHINVGQTVLALCYFESVTLAADSIRISDGVDGYAFAWSNNAITGEGTTYFNKTAEELKALLPPCEEYDRAI